jgi:hypothetical protein
MFTCLVWAGFIDGRCSGVVIYGHFERGRQTRTKEGYSVSYLPLWDRSI